MKLKLLATNEEHRRTIAELLRTESSRVRMAFLHIYDKDLLIDGVKLHRLFRRLLAIDTKLTIIVGELGPEERKQEVLNFLSELENYGARVWVNPNVHAKVILVEGRDGHHRIFVSSANLSQTALYVNYELGVEIDEPEQWLYGKVRDFFNGILGSKQSRELEEYVV